MKLQQILTIAEQIKQQLLPHCERKDGYLYKDNEIIPIPEEEDLFRRCGLKFIPLEKRELFFLQTTTNNFYNQ